MQLELTEDSQPLTCINTHRGLFQFTRLVLGYRACDISKTMERILAGIEGICIFLDDILISGPNKDTHRKRLNEAHDLLKWVQNGCGRISERSETVKRALESELALAHYDPRLSTVLTVDASPTGLGAVLAQQQEDGSERVIAFASRALTPSERVYSQIQKEATAIIFGVKKFHQYLYGRADPFVLKTDHKPLLSIFGNKKGIPEMTANRLQRYALFLSAYNYTVQRRRAVGSGGPIDADIESAVGACGARRCGLPRPARHSRPGRTPRPWERVHLDMLSVAGGTHPSWWTRTLGGVGSARGRRTEPVLRRLSEMLGTPFIVRPVSPAQLMLGRNVRTRLDLLCPRKDVPKHVAPAPSAANLAQSVSRSQISQSKYFGGKRKLILPSVIKL
ncbi:Transposon Tf2-9 polyprotein [Eumeta japonica]|uniref:Transposon Tf2-9 polyprotein n=1 Tax=Eumeta variegata TaxID=151549 RepID=A0A4C2A767_EUMVA|nr:Transposon Tf2-9 polyprotein [Eumeta japonica]